MLVSKKKFRLISYILLPVFSLITTTSNAEFKIIEVATTSYNYENNRDNENQYSAPESIPQEQLGNRIEKAKQNQNLSNTAALKVKPSLPHNGYYLASLQTPDELAKQAKTSNKVLIKAYTDDEGNNLYIQSLAKNQAENLKALLIQYGVPKEKIEVYVFTNNFLTNNLTSSNKAKNRRVTVNFE
jgi:outer membrane protein OmpA-like peptidoglycan-associated protein